VRIATGASADPNGGVDQGALLRAFAEEILDRSRRVGSARDACIEAIGVDATIQAASIVASFDGINRVADATGIRLDPESARNGSDQIIEALEFEALGAARA
jgi:hypothetical protein